MLILAPFIAISYILIDLGATLEDNISSQNDEGTVSINASRDSNRQKPKLGRKETLNDELISIMESASGQDVAAISKKRTNERSDYKRLYDVSVISKYCVRHDSFSLYISVLVFSFSRFRKLAKILCYYSSHNLAA